MFSSSFHLWTSHFYCEDKWAASSLWCFWNKGDGPIFSSHLQRWSISCTICIRPKPRPPLGQNPRTTSTKCVELTLKCYLLAHVLELALIWRNSFARCWKFAEVRLTWGRQIMVAMSLDTDIANEKAFPDFFLWPTKANCLLPSVPAMIFCLPVNPEAMAARGHGLKLTKVSCNGHQEKRGGANIKQCIAAICFGSSRLYDGVGNEVT